MKNKMAQSFQDLVVWQRAMEMTVSVYRVTKSFPREEIYGLTSQLRRAAVSVASNIAEGRGRITQGEFRQFLGLAQGSSFEVQTQILVAKQLEMGQEKRLDEAQSLSIEDGKMLSSLIASLGAKS
ncbi:MAG TPA: four helix bundle protein [Acidobacteriaceae bacterium]|nr:four helix bundle protein [Acidobacteriaceae bacterium]